MKEYPVKSYFDFDDSIKTIFVRTFNEYLYPRIIAEHAELFKKNFKILEMILSLKVLCKQNPLVYRIFMILMKKNLNKILVPMLYFGHVIVIQIGILNWQYGRQ